MGSEEIRNSHNIGTIACQLWWDGKTQGVYMLPAVPQIDSVIIVGADEMKDFRSFVVTGTQMTAVAINPDTFDAFPTPPTCLSYVKVFLAEDEPPLFDSAAGPI